MHSYINKSSKIRPIIYISCVQMIYKCKFVLCLMCCIMDWLEREEMGTSTDYGHPERVFFFRKSQTFGLGQTNWAEKFWGIWGIFGRFFSTHFGTVGSLSVFSINQPLFLQKTKPLYPNPQNLFGSGS